MFQNIQQFHSGGSNTNSFRLLATLFKTKDSIDMRILSTELSQLKRVAIIMPLQKAWLFSNWHAGVMVKPVVHQAQGGEDRFLAGSRALLIGFRVEEKD